MREYIPDKSPKTNVTKMEVGDLSDKELKIIGIKMLTDVRRSENA